VVAVKTMLFPAAMSGKEKREKMAIMETAISSTLSHPNIVQTYTYVVKPLTGELALQVCAAAALAGHADACVCHQPVAALLHRGWGCESNAMRSRFAQALHTLSVVCLEQQAGLSGVETRAGHRSCILL
jgi:hypothetical protein